MGDFSIQKNINDMLPPPLDPTGGANSLSQQAMDAFRMIRLVNDIYNAVNAGTVTGIQGIPVSSTTPTDAQFLVYNSGTGQWVPVSMSGDASITDAGVLKVIGINGTNMTIEGLSDRAFAPKQGTLATTAIFPSSQTAHFCYVGTTANAITPKHVKFFCSTIAGIESAAEVGLFSSPNPPNGTSQTLTKLTSGTVARNFTASSVNANTSDLSTSIAAGTHLWAGWLSTWSVQPNVGGLVGDHNTGSTATLAMGSNTFAGTSSYATTMTSFTAFGTNQVVYLVVTLD